MKFLLTTFRRHPERSRISGEAKDLARIESVPALKRPPHPGRAALQGRVKHAQSNWALAPVLVSEAA